MEVCSYNYSRWCEYYRGSLVSFVTTDELTVRITKNILWMGVSWAHRIPFCVKSPFWLNEMAILSKVGKPDNLEPQNSLTLSFNNIRSPHFYLAGYESFLESSSPDILSLCETNLEDSIDSKNCSVRGYTPLIERIPLLIYMVLRFCEEGLFCTELISEKLLLILISFHDRLDLLRGFTPFSSIYHYLRHRGHFLIIFHLT